MIELVVALGAGLISFLSPCVLPLIPGYVSFVTGSSLNEILENKKIKLNILNFGVLRRKYFNFFGIINRIFKITSSLRIINKYLRSHKIDLVYTSTSIILAGAISAKLNKIPNYFHIHEIPNNKIYLKIMGSIVSYLSSKVIVVSKSVEDHWKKYLKNTFSLRRCYEQNRTRIF